VPTQPFSAKRPRSLPTVTPAQDINQTLAIWQNTLAPGVQNAAPQPTPQNFTITNARGGLTLNWSPVGQGSGTDGYEILKSPSGSFTDDLQVIPVHDPNQSTFFDSMGGTSKTAFYRIRTTSGTANSPQSARGPESGVIKHTSIDAADTKTTPVTVFDNFTTDKTRSLARLGNYGAIKLSSQSQPAVARGTVGGSGYNSGAAAVRAAVRSSGNNSSVGAGTGSLAASGAPGSQPPTTTGTPFNDITTGTNNSASMILSSGASIAPSAVNPGTIDATEIQGTPVTTATPSDGELLQYSAASGGVVYAAIIEQGTQANLSSVLPLALGEIYVATDTGNLFIGTPGFGSGYLQVGDTTRVNETLLQILMEMRAMRLAMTSLACQGAQANPQDFNPQALASDAEVADMAQI
jgi:hypothetical protein